MVKRIFIFLIMPCLCGALFFVPVLAEDIDEFESLCELIVSDPEDAEEYLLEQENTEDYSELEHIAEPEDAFGPSAEAEYAEQSLEIVNSGSCGENVEWSLDDEGVLTISGVGAMYDYVQNSPWHNSSLVKQVVIKAGVTSIGNCAALTRWSPPPSKSLRIRVSV